MTVDCSQHNNNNNNNNNNNIYLFKLDRVESSKLVGLCEYNYNMKLYYNRDNHSITYKTQLPADEKDYFK